MFHANLTNRDKGNIF